MEITAVTAAAGGLCAQQLTSDASAVLSAVVHALRLREGAFSDPADRKIPALFRMFSCSYICFVLFPCQDCDPGSGRMMVIRDFREACRFQRSFDFLHGVVFHPVNDLFKLQ